MECGVARKILYSSQVLHGDKPAPVETETKDARRASEQCGVCQQFFAKEKSCQHCCGQTRSEEAASSTLREQVLVKSLKSNRKRAANSMVLSSQAERDFPLRGFPSGRIVIRGSVVTLNAMLKNRTVGIDSGRRHVRYQSATTEVTSSEPQVINAWFRDRVRFSVQRRVCQTLR